MWIYNHYTVSLTWTSPCVKFYYLFPEDAHVKSEDPQHGRVVVFYDEDDKVMVGYASFSPNGDLVAFSDEADEGYWTEHTKFEGVELWKLLIRAGSHYHFNPETGTFCGAVTPKRPNRRPNAQTSQYALEA